MNDRRKTRAHLMAELQTLRARLAERESEEADLKRMEETLREEEYRYRSFVQNFQGIAFRARGDFVPIFFHGAVEQITGYTEEEFKAGRPRWDQVIHPDDLPAMYNTVEKVKTVPGSSADVEYRIIRKDGQVRWVRELVQSVCDDSGRPAFFQGAVYDITERRRAEEALRIKDAAIASAINAIAIADLEGNLTYVNDSFLNMMGYDDSGEVLARPGVTFCETEERAWEVVEALRDSGGWIGELVAMRKDGSLFDVELSASMVKDEAGEPICMLASFVDITERRRAEQESRKNLVLLTSVMEGTPDPVFLKDRQGRYEILNIAAARALGRASVQEVLGRDDTELIPRELARKLQENDRKIMESGAPVEYEELVGTEDSQRTYRTMKSPYRDEHGDVMGIIGVARDVTDLKRAEEALRGERDKAQSCLDIAGTMIALVDRSERITLINKKGCEILGYQQEELLGQNWFDLLVPQRIGAEVRGFFQKLMAGQTAPVEYYENPLLTRDGEERLIAFHNTVLTEPSGRITATLFSAEDITERKRAEAALREARDELERRVDERTAELAKANEDLLEEIAERKRAEQALRESGRRYRDLFEQAPVGIGLATIDGKALSVNEAMEVITGYSSEEFKKLNVADLYENIEDRKALLEAINRHGGVSSFPVRLKRKDGTPYDAILNVSPVHHADGEDVLQTICMDVTDRERAEEALRESEKRFKNIFNNALVGIYRTTPDGRIVMANPTLVRMLGYDSFEELAKRNLEEEGFELRYSRSDFRERIEAEGRVVGLESAWRRRDGSILFVTENAKATRDEHGNTLYYEGIVQDITDRKKAEERIEASLKEKEVLLKEIQHRVKNNLQVISSLFDLQSRYTYDERMINVLKESQNRLRSIALIHEKLYEAEDLTRINFAEYVSSLAVHLFRSYGATSTDIRLKTDLDDVALSVDTAIPCALIVNELISNCLKHAFPSGNQAEIRVELSSDDNNSTLIVGDNGVGLPEDLDFDDPGSLGLRLVRTLTHQLKGTIDLNRKGGTTFAITFPRP